MPKLPVVNQEGKEIKKIELSDAVFGIEPHKQSMFDAILVYQANKRQATAKTKTRSEVSGGGRKPWRQKGTGRARQGSTRSPQWRHGGVAFGPTGQQNYTLKQNKKEAKLALKSALSSKVTTNSLIVVDNLDLPLPKTKEALKVLKNLNSNAKTLMIIDGEYTSNISLATSNLPNVVLLHAASINVYDVMNSASLIVTEEAVKAIEEVLQ